MTSSAQPLQRLPYEQAHLNEVRLLCIRTAAQGQSWRAKFVEAYRLVFRMPPYREQFAQGEIEATWDRLTTTPGHISVLAINSDLDVVGFGLSIPLQYEHTVARELAGLLPPAHTFYLAELGVLREYRHCGLGTDLLRARLDRIDAQVYRGIALRASASRESHQLYTNMGFQDTGVSMHVRHLRTSGEQASDQRIFLHCVLSQVRLDKPNPAA
ncbi:MAG: GNAT superfamily N-acetyltransferase [Kiritimatiellia bacterium]|jgi:GNAT superfamily N-acetyltransferase